MYKKYQKNTNYKWENEPNRNINPKLRFVPPVVYKILAVLFVISLIFKIIELMILRLF